jgi:hypothetical protein
MKKQHAAQISEREQAAVCRHSLKEKEQFNSYSTIFNLQ